ncbi:MAG TPA: dCTP deaminase [Candidatus Babeliales bacterium]|nr:dCTP deaminase [Candidatus Babeliales bacterium]
MFLSHTTIEKNINDRKIIIGPQFNKKNIRPVGIRLHLAREILIPEHHQTVNLTQPTELRYTTIDIEKNEFYIEPGNFILAATYETIQTTPDIVAVLDGRSTIARLGLTTHITASIIDGTYGAPHAPTLEIKNMGPFRIRLNYLDPIAMLLFAQLTEPITQKQQDQYTKTPNKVTPPLLYKYEQ